MVKVHLAISKCLDCPSDVKVGEGVFLDVNSTYFISQSGNRSFHLSNVSITGHSSSSVPLLDFDGSPHATLENVNFHGIQTFWTLIYASRSNLSLLNCSFLENSAYTIGSVTTRAYAALLDSEHSQIHLINCNFAFNHLRLFLRPRTHSELLIAASMIAGGDDRLLVSGCLFRNNTVLADINLSSLAQTQSHNINSDNPNTLVAEWMVYGGALSLHSRSSLTTVIHSQFINNSILLEKSVEAWTGGAAIGVKAGASLVMEHTDFEGNTADIGAALYVVESAGEMGDLSYLMVKGGNVRNHICRIRGCGFAFYTQRITLEVSIQGTNFENNQLYHPFLQAAGDFGSTLRFSGGVAVAFFVDSDVLFGGSLSIMNTTFRNNWITGWTTRILGGGRALALFQLSQFRMYNCSFYDTSRYGAEDLPIIWSRWFESIHIESVYIKDFVPRGSTWSTQLFDLRLAMNVHGVEEPLKFLNCVFSNSYADSYFEISDVESAYFENIHFAGSTDFGPEIAASNLFAISFVNGLVTMKNIESKGVGALHLTDVAELILMNSNFTWVNQPRFIWQLDLSGVAMALVSDCYFHLGGVTAGISAPMTRLSVFNSFFIEASLPPSPSESGAAIRAENSEVTISNCTFTDSNAARGGAVFVSGPTIILNSQFVSNQADSAGGALFISQGPAVIHNCSFENNFAKDSGGAIFLVASVSKDTSQYSISNSSFTTNAAGRGGAVCSYGFDVSNVANSRFSQNLATTMGGALMVTSGSQLIAQSQFEGNLVNNPSLGLPPASAYGNSKLSYCGGAVLSEALNLNISESEFINNVAVHGGAVWRSQNYSTIISGSNFISNKAQTGGALVVDGSYVTRLDCVVSLRNLTFRFNNASGDGGALLWSLQQACRIKDLEDCQFSENWAKSAGGAVYASSYAHAYPDYKNLTFLDNFSSAPGGTFFHAQPRLDVDTLSPIDFCSPDRCTVSANWSSSYAPQNPPSWGLIQASSLWNVSLIGISPVDQYAADQYDYASADATGYTTVLFETGYAVDIPDSFTAHAIEYYFFVSFMDGYGQEVLGPQIIYSHPVLTCDIESECDFSASTSLSVPNAARVAIQAKSSLVRPTQPYSSESGASQMRPRSANLSIVFSQSGVSRVTNTLQLSIKVGGCPKGYGLSADGSQASCKRCPIFSYNLNGDGYCYSCNSGITKHLECEGATVSYRDNYWAASPNQSNVLLVEKCMIGYCERGSCSKYRKGLLCGECVKGSYESLFSACSPSICTKPSYGLFILFGVCLMTFAVAIHLVLALWPAATIFWILIAQLSFGTVSRYIDWSIPLRTPLLANFLCGYRMDGIERQYWLTFAPYFALAGLALFWLCIALVSFIRKSMNFTSNSRSLTDPDSAGHWKRIVRTMTAILYVNAYWSLNHSVQWLLCKKTVFGDIWLLNPAILCDDPAFSRPLFLALSVPLALLPLALALISVLLALPQTHPRFKASSTRLTILLQSFSFILSCPSKYWSLIEIVCLRIAFPIFSSGILQQGALESGCLCLLLLFCATASAWLRPLPNKYVHATGPLCMVAVLTILRQDFHRNTLAPIVATSLVIFLLALLALMFFFTRHITRFNRKAHKHTDTMHLGGINTDRIESSPSFEFR